MSVCLQVAIGLIVVLSVFNTIWIILHSKETEETIQRNLEILDTCRKIIDLTEEVIEHNRELLNDNKELSAEHKKTKEDNAEEE